MQGTAVQQQQEKEARGEIISIVANADELSHNIIWLSVKSAKRMLRPSDLSSEMQYCSFQSCDIVPCA